MVLRKIKNLFQQEKGATALYFAMVLFLLLGMGSIALDGSNLYVQRSRMQTAADAATLAGANVLALGGNTAAIDAVVKSMAMANGVGDVPWTIGANGKSIQASAPDDLDVEWNYTNDNKDIEVSVGNEHKTFFAGLLGYDTLTTTGVSKAGHEPITVVDNLFPLAVNGCDCLEFEQFPVSLTKDDFAAYITAIYQIDDVNDASVDYTMFLQNLDPAYPGTSANRPYYMFYNSDTNGTLTEYGDSTARVVQSVVNVNGDGFMVDLRYSGRTSIAPDGDSPNCDGVCSDTTDWYYYATTTGLLTGLPGTRYEGAIIQVTRRDSSMQIGTNAHLKDPQPEYGAAGWLTLDVLQQPTTGVTLQSHNEEGENNFILTLNEEEEEVACNLYPIALSSTTLSNAVVGASYEIWNGVQPGNFGWLTWAGSPNVPTLATSLTPPGDSDTYINPDDTSDTIVSVGDWVQGSPGVSNASSVRDALDTLMTIDITVPVWDQATAQGNNSLYRVTAFAVVRITDYQLPNTNEIIATFKGYADDCSGNGNPTPESEPTPTPTLTPTSTPTSVSIEEPEVEFCTYNLRVKVGETFNMRNYVTYKDNDYASYGVDWSKVSFTYTGAGANNPTTPTDWNLSQFNSGTSVTTTSADRANGTGNQGKGKYRIYMVRNGQTTYDDHMTIEVHTSQSDVASAQCATTNPPMATATPTLTPTSTPTPIPTETPMIQPTPTPPPTTDTPCELAWLDWDGGIAADSETIDYLNNLGLSGTWSVGDTVPAGPEVEHVQQVANALDQWLDKPVTVAFYDEGNQDNGYQICGFAQFTMSEYDFTSLPEWLQGEFNLGTVRGVTDPDAPDYGLRGLRFH
jgi:Flp pilus assembly protein TadG